MNEAPASPTKPGRWWPIVGPLLIVAAALCYYGSYLRFWFNPHDEGGTAAFIAARLLAGEAPFKDIELGYNVGWFWPIAALFKVGGVNFLLMRGYFFALSTLTAVLGWMVVRKTTRNEVLAICVGLALVIFPGSQFKNYMGLICVVNTLAIVNAALWSGASAPAFWRRVTVGGLVLGISFLIRIDLGYLFALLWLGVIFLRLFDGRVQGKGRIVDAIAAAAALLAGIVVTHAPVLAIAKVGGYKRPFLAQYVEWAEFLGGQAGAVVTGGEKSTTPEQRTDAQQKDARREESKKSRMGEANRPMRYDRTTLPRTNWATAISFTNEDKTVLFALTYAPLVVYAALFLWAAWGVLASLVRRRFALNQPSALALLVLFGSLTAFPQFFFFRPDRPHLSEFMPGYIVATVCAVALTSGKFRWAVGTVLALQFALFGWFAFDHYSAGTIAARITIKHNKRTLFEGANGVRVWVHKKDYEELEGVRRAVLENSKPGEWLVCYPYQPGYNLMCDRPTYERELYQDNATAPRGWARNAIARFKEKKPAVVIIDNRPINQVESSRFSVWARGVYENVKSTYVQVAKIDTIEVYARDAKSPPPEDGASTSPPPPEPK